MNRESSPRISIITPSFNREKFIELSIKSILSQSYQNYEHIIVDGASTDGTLDIIRKYDGKYNMRWISEPDKGMYDAINKGLKLARGEIVAYLNTDDLYLPWTLEVVANVFSRPKNKDIGFIYGDAIRVDLINNRDRLILLSRFKHRTFALCRGMGIVQPSAFLRTSTLDKVGYFNIDYKLSADSEFWVRIAGNGIKHKKINEILSVEIAHQKAISYNESSAKLYRNDVISLRKQYCKTYNDFISNVLDAISKIIKIKSKILYRLYLIAFVISYVLCKALKVRVNMWPCMIEKGGDIDVKRMVKESIVPYNKKSDKMHPLFQATKDALVMLERKK